MHDGEHTVEVPSRPRDLKERGRKTIGGHKKVKRTDADCSIARQGNAYTRNDTTACTQKYKKRNRSAGTLPRAIERVCRAEPKLARQKLVMPRFAQCKKGPVAAREPDCSRRGSSNAGHGQRQTATKHDDGGEDARTRAKNSEEPATPA